MNENDGFQSRNLLFQRGLGLFSGAVRKFFWGEYLVSLAAAGSLTGQHFFALPVYSRVQADWNPVAQCLQETDSMVGSFSFFWGGRFQCRT